MPVVTINGQIGCAVEVGVEVAQRLGIPFVDRVVLAEAGKRLGVPVEALEEEERRIGSLRQRLAKLLDSALRGASQMDLGDPAGYFSSLLERPYPEGAKGSEHQARGLTDIVSEVIRDLSAEGNVVIVGRAGNIVLRDAPGSLHVRTVAPLEFRIATIVARQRLEEEAAAAFVEEEEDARIAYFRRFFGEDPNNPLLYDLVVNLGTLGVPAAAQLIAETATLVAAGATGPSRVK